MITGKNIILTAVEKEHLAQLMHWRNLPDFRQYFREYRELNMEDQLNWFENVVVKDRNTIMFSILDKTSSTLIGCCGLCYINWVHRYAELSFYIGCDEVYIDNKYAPDVCKTILDYGFNQLGLNKIWTEIYDFDAPKKELLVDELGFKIDGALRQNYFYNGKWNDSLILSLLCNELK